MVNPVPSVGLLFREPCGQTSAENRIMTNTPKTLEEHRQYLYDICRLKLFFISRWLKDHPEEKFSDVLRNRVDIFRKTDLNPEGINAEGIYFDNPDWLALESRLEEIWKMVKGDDKLFEEWGFDLIRPHLDNRCERDYLDRSAFAGYQCGFLRYNLFIMPERPDTLGFHIANDRQPASIFDDLDYARECFNKLLDAAENRFAVSNIGTGTWLNNHPKWLAFFPEEWRTNLGEPNTNVAWHYGFWGQFINARGTFNAKAAAKVRETGKLQWFPRYSKCSVKAMREHINSL